MSQLVGCEQITLVRPCFNKGNDGVRQVPTPDWYRMRIVRRTLPSCGEVKIVQRVNKSVRSGQKTLTVYFGDV